MHSFPNVEEVDRYITERLLIAGSDQPKVFTPDAVDFIFQCSEGIPRNINNICDNAMLTAYAAGERLIGRKIIEEVAENLDLIPETAKRPAIEAAPDFSGGGVLRPEAREELWNNNQRPVQPTFQAASNNLIPTSHSKPNGLKFDDFDDEIHLEIG